MSVEIATAQSNVSMRLRNIYASGSSVATMAAHLIHLCDEDLPHIADRGELTKLLVAVIEDHNEGMIEQLSELAKELGVEDFFNGDDL